MNIVEIISIFGGVGGFTGLVGFLVTLKSKKKIEESNANKAETEASALINAEWKKLYDEQDDKINKLELQVESIKKESDDKLRVIDLQVSQLKRQNRGLYSIYNKAYKCPLVKTANDCIVIKEVERLTNNQNIEGI